MDGLVHSQGLRGPSFWSATINADTDLPSSPAVGTTVYDSAPEPLEWRRHLKVILVSRRRKRACMEL